MTRRLALKTALAGLLGALLPKVGKGEASPPDDVMAKIPANAVTLTIIGPVYGINDEPPAIRQPSIPPGHACVRFSIARSAEILPDGLWLAYRDICIWTFAPLPLSES